MHEPFAAASPHRAVFLDVAVFGTRIPEGAAAAPARPGECRSPSGNGEGRTSPFTTSPRYVAPIRGTFLPRPPRDSEGRAGLPPSGGTGAGNPLAQRAPARSRGPGKAKRPTGGRDRRPDAGETERDCKRAPKARGPLPRNAVRPLPLALQPAGPSVRGGQSLGHRTAEGDLPAPRSARPRGGLVLAP